jgi:hypothetical protein
MRDRQAEREKVRQKRLKEVAGRSAPIQSRLKLTAGILVVLGVVVGLLVFLGSDDEMVRGPGSVTIYMIDTSGSQDLAPEDVAERDEARVDRILRAANDEADRSGLLIVSTFSDKGTGIATRPFDFSPKHLECKKPGSEVCSTKREKATDALEEEITGFVASISFAGRTDVLGGAISRGASMAGAVRSETVGRRLIVESDFLNTECPELGENFKDWPPSEASAAEALRSCAGSSDPVTEFEAVQFNGVVLTKGADLADVQRAVRIFRAYCDLVDANCDEGL